MLQVPGQRTWSRFFPTAAMSASLGSCQFTVNALQLARDHRQLFRSELHNQGHASQLSSSDECIAILLLMLRDCCVVLSIRAACYLQAHKEEEGALT